MPGTSVLEVIEAVSSLDSAITTQLAAKQGAFTSDSFKAMTLTAMNMGARTVRYNA